MCTPCLLFHTWMRRWGCTCRHCPWLEAELETIQVQLSFNTKVSCVYTHAPLCYGTHYCTTVLWHTLLHHCVMAHITAPLCYGTYYCTTVLWHTLLHHCVMAHITAPLCYGTHYCTTVLWHTLLHHCVMAHITAPLRYGTHYCTTVLWHTLLHHCVMAHITAPLCYGTHYCTTVLWHTLLHHCVMAHITAPLCYGTHYCTTPLAVLCHTLHSPKHFEPYTLCSMYCDGGSHTAEQYTNEDSTTYSILYTTACELVRVPQHMG